MPFLRLSPHIPAESQWKRTTPLFPHKNPPTPDGMDFWKEAPSQGNLYQAQYVSSCRTIWCAPMLLPNAFNGFRIEYSFIPKAVSFLLYFFCIVFSQHILQFCHGLCCLTVAHHFQNMELHWVECFSCCIHVFSFFHLAKLYYFLLTAKSSLKVLTTIVMYDLHNFIEQQARSWNEVVDLLFCHFNEIFIISLLTQTEEL